MRRTPQYFACAGLELARYFALVYAAKPFTAGWPMAPTVLRIVAVPNLVFAAAFFFLGLDTETYSAYRPLILLGKAISVFSSALALPKLLNFGGDDPTGSVSYAILAMAAWDLIAIGLLAFPGKRGGAPAIAAAPDAEPERVEMD